AGLREQGDVRGVARTGAGADRVDEVLVGGVLDGDAGLLREGGQGGVEAVGLHAAEVAEDGDDAVAGRAARGATAAIAAATAAAAALIGVLQAAGEAERGGRRGAAQDGAAGEVRTHGVLLHRR